MRLLTFDHNYRHDSPAGRRPGAAAAPQRASQRMLTLRAVALTPCVRVHGDRGLRRLIPIWQPATERSPRAEPEPAPLSSATSSGIMIVQTRIRLGVDSRLKLPAPSEAPDSEQLDAAVLTLARGRWAAGPGFESPARSATRTGSCSFYYDFRVRSSRHLT
jgi:hypothetical protein